MNIRECTELAVSRLDDVKLETLPIKEVTHKVGFSDTFNAQVKGKKIYVVFKREIRFASDEIFNLEVSYLNIWNIHNEKASVLKDFLESASDEDKDFLIASSASEASLVISQLFNAMHMTPFITPPNYSPRTLDDVKP